MQQNTDPKAETVAALAKKIESHRGWWLFPTEPGGVQGFLGTAPIFIVGDQPSTSPWPQNHPHRRAFYDILLECGLANAHITDLYKKRGVSNELNTHIPDDFGEHVQLFREELDLLQPTRVIALGNLAHRLIRENLPEIRPILEKMLHFGALYRVGRENWITSVRASLLQSSAPARAIAVSVSKSAPSRVFPNPSFTPRSGTQRAVMCALLVQNAGEVGVAAAAYATAEQMGRVLRERNASGLSPLEYAYALVKDGLRRGWLTLGA